MKRNVCVLFVLLGMLYLLTAMVSAEERVYRDNDRQIVIPLPEGWVQKKTDIVDLLDGVSARFEHGGDLEWILYSQKDMMDEAPDQLDTPSGRAFLDEQFLAYAQELEGQAEHIQVKMLGDGLFCIVTIEEQLEQGGTDVRMSAFSVQNGYYHKFVFLSGPDDALYADFEQLLSGIQFLNKPDGLVYTDENSQITIVFPEGWKEKLPTGDDVKELAGFVHEEDGTKIAYLQMDSWSALSAEEKRIRSRADMDDAFFDTDELASELGAAADSVEEKTLGGRRYCIMDMELPLESGAVQPCVMACSVQNGYIHAFLFLGEKDSARYSEFEQILSGIQYLNEPETETGGAKLLGYGLVFLAVLALIGGLVLAIVLRAGKRKTQKRPKGYCVTCGAELTENTNFCTVCGTAVRPPEAVKTIEDPEKTE